MNDIVPNADALLSVGLNLYNQKRYQDALAYFSRAIEEDPTCGEAWAYRALSRILLREEAFPLHDLDQALALLEPPPDERRQRLRALVLRFHAAGLHQLGRHAEALADLDAAASFGPPYVSDEIRRGDSYRALGQPEQAAAAYRQAIAEGELGDVDTELWLGVAQALLELDDFAAALDAAQIAIQQEQDKALGWTKRAHALLYLARYQECLESAERALTLDSADFNTWGVKGSALAHLRRYQEAQVAFHRAYHLALPSPAARVAAFRGEFRVLLRLRRFRAAWRLMMGEVGQQLRERQSHQEP